MSDIRIQRPPHQRFGVVVRLRWGRIQVGYLAEAYPDGMALKWWIEPPHDGLHLTQVEALMIHSIVVADAAYPIKPGY